MIGISSYETEASWSGRHAAVALLPMAYVRSVVDAGGAPVLLPPAVDPSAVVERLDGVIIAGGPDVDPARYGAPRDPRTQAAVPARDEFEAQLIAFAAERRLPTLCICRGAQLLNVVRGGSLHQHLPEVVGGHHHDPGDGRLGTSVVSLETTSRLAGVLGEGPHEVACHHHQAVARVGAGLVPVAWAEDGTIEALEDPDEPALLAVQWHPEERDDLSLFGWLVDAATLAASSSR